MDDLDEAAHLPLGLRLGAFAAGRLFFLDFVARKGFREDFDERTVAGEVDGQVALFLLDGDIQADEGLPRPGHARDEADAFLVVGFGLADDVEDEVRAGVDACFVRLMLGDILHAVVHVEGGCRLDDRGRGVVAAVEPLVSVDGRLRSFFGEDLLDGGKQPRTVGEQRIIDLIVIDTEEARAGRAGFVGGFRGHEDRNDDPVAALLVEVLQVEGVVPDLLFVVDEELVGADFEFDGEDNAAGQQNHVYTLPQTGNGVFEDDVPFASQFPHDLLHDGDFLLPGIPLLEGQVKFIQRAHFPQDGVVIRPEESGTSLAVIEFAHVVCVEQSQI